MTIRSIPNLRSMCGFECTLTKDGWYSILIDGLNLSQTSSYFLQEYGNVLKYLVSTTGKNLPNHAWKRLGINPVKCFQNFWLLEAADVHLLSLLEESLLVFVISGEVSQKDCDILRDPNIPKYNSFKNLYIECAFENIANSHTIIHSRTDYGIVDLFISQIVYIIETMYEDIKCVKLPPTFYIQQILEENNYSLSIPINYIRKDDYFITIPMGESSLSYEIATSNWSIDE